MTMRNITQLTESELAEWRTFGERNREAWDALHAAAKRDGIWIGGDWGEVKFNCAGMPELKALQDVAYEKAVWKREHGLV